MTLRGSALVSTAALPIKRWPSFVRKRLFRKGQRKRAYTSDGETSAGFLDGSRHHISIKTERAQLFQAQLGFVKLEQPRYHPKVTICAIQVR